MSTSEFVCCLSLVCTCIFNFHVEDWGKNRVMSIHRKFILIDCNARIIDLIESCDVSVHVT